MENWFEKLMTVNVNEHVEKKNGLSYLSWMWAWQELKRRYPLSYATVHETAEGMLVWKDPVGCHVKTSVTLVWQDDEGQHEHTVYEYLPVMDFKNKSIPYESADSMSINKTIQRSLTKCIARLGLGGYIYAGEDLPEEPEEEKQRKLQEQEKLKNVISLIDKEVIRLTKSMTQAEKGVFANETIVPILGQLNYKTCKDVDRLSQLLEKVKAA